MKAGWVLDVLRGRLNKACSKGKKRKCLRNQSRRDSEKWENQRTEVRRPDGAGFRVTGKVR